MGDATAVLEREAELAMLDGLLDELVSGRGRALLVEGVAGIGKSTLLRALVDAAREREDVLVLSARATELELELAFGAVRELFAPVVARGGETLSRALDGPAALAAAVLGLREMAHDDLADPLYALSWLVSNLAEEQPLVLAIDDVHWLDAESGRFVAYLAQRLEGLSVLLAGSARPREPGAMASPLDTFREMATTISPPPLSAAAAGAVVGGATPASEAHRLTGGNPFLLRELGRALELADPGTDLEMLGTRAVATSVTQRVRRISPDAVALADTVALFAAGTELAVAAQTAGLDAGAAAAAADALVAADVLVADGAQLEFLHPLMRAAVYDALGPFARRGGHAAAARALKRRSAPVDHIAAHLLAGEPEGDAENLRVLEAAAHSAIAAVAPRAAVRYLERAVAEGAAEPAQERRLLLELGRWQRMTGAPQARDTLARALALSAGTPEHVRAATELTATAFAHADHALVTRTVDAMRDVEMAADDRLVLDMLLAESLWGDMQTDASMRLIDAVPRDLPGDTPAQRMALAMAGAARLLRCDPMDEVVDMLRRSIGEDGTAPSPVAGIDVGDPLQWILQAGDLDAAQALAEERMEHARATGDEALYASTQNAYGWLLGLRGDFAGAIAAYRLGLSNPAISPFMRAHIAGNLTGTLIDRGEIAAAEIELDALERDAFPAVAHIVDLRRAQIALTRCDYAAAIPAFDANLALQRTTGAEVHPNVFWLMPEYTEALAALGRTEEAIALAREFLERSERLGVSLGRGIHGSALGRLTGDLDMLARAVDVLAQSPYRWYEARARLELGSALRRAGERAAAREQLRTALEYLEPNGVVLLAARTREELAVSGARLRAAPDHSGATALTPAELRIARLAADGMTNKQIAQHLFVTVGTVQTTLVHCYRKLDVRGRRELAGALP